MKRTNKLTEGNINTILIGLAIPIMGSSFLQMAYNFIDMIWIGRLGSEAVAGIGTASFFINLGYALNSMIVMGAGIRVAHNIGSKNYKATKEYITNSFFMNFILSAIYILFILVFKKNLIAFFNLNNTVVEAMAETYLTITGIGLVFKFANFLFVRIINSYGDSKLPFKINCVGVLINIILDPILIFGLNMGVMGAAVATIIAEGINTIIFIYKSKQYFELDNIFKYDKIKIKDIAKLGMPMAVQRILFTCFGIVIARIIAKWGADAIATQKIGLQVESISYMTAGGLYGAMASFIGQNYGAKKYERIREGYKVAFVLAIIIGIITTTLFVVFPKEIMHIFVKDKNTVEMGIGYLRIIGLSQLFMCIEIITNGSFSGIGKPKIPSTISIIFTGMRIPIALFLSQESMFGINGVWMSISLTSIIKGLLTFGIFITYLNKMNNNVTGEI